VPARPRDGEVLALLQQGLVNAKRAKQIDEIRGEFIAIDTALARLQAGDLCLVRSTRSTRR